MKNQLFKLEHISDTAEDKLKHAQWVFERMLGWVAAAEIKVAAISAIDTAMLGGLAAMCITDKAKSPWAVFFSVGATSSILVGMLCAAMVLVPRLGGPDRSLIFFGKIAQLTAIEYGDKFRDVEDTDLLRDLTDQIHRNSEIAHRKHGWVRACLYWSLFSLPFWLGLVVNVVAP